MKKIITSMVAIFIWAQLVAQAQATYIPSLYTSGFGENNTIDSALFVEDFTNEYNVFIESGLGTNDSTVLSHATVNGTSTAGEYDFVSFNVEMPNTYYIFDIDNVGIGGLDTFIWLFDTDKTTVLSSNDDSSFAGPGDSTDPLLNSFMTYNFETEGMYYLRIGEHDISPPYSDGPILYSDDTYDLHISRGNPVPIPGAVWLLGSGLLGLVGLRRKK